MTVRITLVGDINLKKDLRMSADRAMALVSDELRSADIRLGNLEGCFSDPGPELPYKPFWHHVETEMAVALLGLFDALGVANNVHYGDAIVESKARLDELGIPHTGAGANRCAAREPVVLTHGDTRIGLLAFTSVFWPVGAAATDTTPGVATIRAYTSYQPHPRAFDMPGGPAIVRTEPDGPQLAEACAAVTKLRERVDIVVVYCHWGVALAQTPAEYQHSIGRALIDAGAHLIAGSSPHVPQGIERYGDGVIMHSLGNFIFGAEHHRQWSRTGLLARARFEKDGLAGLVLVPTARNGDDQVELLDVGSGEGAEIADFVVRASADLSTMTTVGADGIHIGL